MTDKNTKLSLFDLAAAFVLHTRQHLFLTGRAGTGKTTFLKYIREKTSKKTVIVAPTGVAAINAGGVTMHSFFQLPIGSFLPVRQGGFSQSPAEGTDLQTLLRNIRFNKEKRQLLEELELLIIDEVSMLRADLLDAMDGILRHFRKQPDQPFGGVQVLYIGDLYQLPPVVREEEWVFMSRYYKSLFFFDALVMADARPLCIELDKIYRQSDEGFIDLLNKIRNNIAGEEDLQLLNKYYDPSFYPEADDGYIILTSHNYKADKINQSALARLQGDTFEYDGELSGDFNENALPAEKKLILKGGAQIMFIRNDKGDARRYYNGKIGIVNRISGDEIYVRFPGEPGELQLEKETWRNIRYNYNEAADKIEEEELGSYKQYPVRLAWAVTIHKSQGLTFEKAIIDAGQSFAPGQVYVALSRLTSLNGLVLSSPITTAAIQTDGRITPFAQSSLPPEELETVLRDAQLYFLADKLIAAFSWTKLATMFRKHQEGYSQIRLPHQEEAVAWSATTLKEHIRLLEVGEKFGRQLSFLLPEAAADHYRQLNDRVQAARSYFLGEIEHRLAAPLKEHYDKTLVKSKVKKYLKSLQLLQAALARKKGEIQAAATMAQGLVEGQNLTMLLAGMELSVQERAGTALSETSGGEKEDSRSVSLRLLREGKSIEDIALERGLVRGTIESHLASFVSTGEVTVRDLVTAEDEETIRKAIGRVSDKTLSAVRSELQNRFSYPVIKVILEQVGGRS